MQTRCLTKLSGGLVQSELLLPRSRPVACCCVRRLSNFARANWRQQPRLRTACSSSSKDALTQTLAGVSANEKREAKSKNLMLGTHDTVDAWRQLDEQFNTYPDFRNFKAIGEGGDDFVQSMATAVEQVLGPVQQDCIRQRLSAQAKYVAVTIGPVRVEHSDQVIAIFGNMRKDKRLRFFI